MNTRLRKPGTLLMLVGGGLAIGLTLFLWMAASSGGNQERALNVIGQARAMRGEVDVVNRNPGAEFQLRLPVSSVPL